VQKLVAGLKQWFLREPRHPGKRLYLGLWFVQGCFFLALGLFVWSGSRSSPATLMFLLLGPYCFALGTAEFVPIRRRGTAAVLRAVALFTAAVAVALLAVEQLVA
jgi:hypothetical protein